MCDMCAPGAAVPTCPLGCPRKRDRDGWPGLSRILGPSRGSNSFLVIIPRSGWRSPYRGGAPDRTGAVLTPKAEAFDDLMDADGTLATTAVAAQLHLGSARKFNERLHELGVIRRTSATSGCPLQPMSTAVSSRWSRWRSMDSSTSKCAGHPRAWRGRVKSLARAQREKEIDGRRQNDDHFEFPDVKR